MWPVHRHTHNRLPIFSGIEIEIMNFTNTPNKKEKMSKKSGVLLFFLLFSTALWASDWIWRQYTLPPSDDTAVHLLTAQAIRNGHWGLYPPLLHIILAVGSIISQNFGSWFLIFLPIITFGALLPLLTYAIFKNIFQEKKHAVLATGMSWISVPLLLQQAFVQSPAEIFSTLFLFLALFCLTKKNYTFTFLAVLLSLATHHLSSLPFIATCITFIFISITKNIFLRLWGKTRQLHWKNITQHIGETPLNALFRETEKKPTPKKRYILSLVMILTLAIGGGIMALQPAYRINIKLLINQIVLNTLEKASDQNNTLYEKPLLPPHVNINNIPAALRSSPVFTWMTVLGGSIILLILRKKHGGKTALRLTLLWFVMLYIFSHIRSEIPHMNIRLLRLMIYPATILAGVGFVALYKTLPKKINTLLFTIFFLLGGIQLAQRINGETAGSNFVRLTSDDIAAIEYINADATPSETVLTNAHYASWIDVKLTPQIYHGQPGQKDEEPPFGKILTSRKGGDEVLDQYGRPIRSIYNITYIYKGYSTPDRNNDLELKHLIKSKRWIIAFQNERVTILKYQPPPTEEKP